MADLFQVVVSGLATGAIWALCAIGFALLWQTSQTINFAQGEFVMLPGFLILAGLHLGLPMWASFLFALVLAILLFGSPSSRSWSTRCPATACCRWWWRPSAWRCSSRTAPS